MLTSPLKIQGSKAKILPWMLDNFPKEIRGRFIEPFGGSLCVALNVPYRDILATDGNPHLVEVWRWLGNIGKDILEGDGGLFELARYYLKTIGEKVAETGNDGYLEIRDEFNSDPKPWLFLALNRLAFNGVVRFSRKGRFNVPYRKDAGSLSIDAVDRLAGLIREASVAIAKGRFVFRDSPWEDVVAEAGPGDFVYCDPPYAGRETGYIGKWEMDDDERLMDALLKARKRGASFALSTWTNALSGGDGKESEVMNLWLDIPDVEIVSMNHRYIVGPKPSLRPKVMEVLVMGK